MKINKFANGIGSTNELFHSNGVAQTNNASLGSMSPQSYQQRLRIERNRSEVNKYRDSHIAQNRRRITPLIRVQEPETPTPTSPQAMRSTPLSRTYSPGSRPMAQIPHLTFREPPPRSYNPYGK
jgi:hypothetical protein